MDDGFLEKIDHCFQKGSVESVYMIELGTVGQRLYQKTCVLHRSVRDILFVIKEKLFK